MKLSIARTLVSHALIFTCSFVCFGQINFEESNWYKETGRYDDWYSRFDLRRYSKEDVELAKARFLKIEASRSSDEWAGLYRMETMLGSAELTWDSENGFVYAFVYHTLASLDYGTVRSGSASVTFRPERPAADKSKRFFEGEHVTVMFGERHLLVPRARMAEFAIWAVGREVPTGRREKEIYTEQGFFWEKIQDSKKPIGAVPILPPAYAHLILKPISLKLLHVGPLRVKRATSRTWGTTSIDHLRTLTLSGGRNDGVKVGMRFWIDDLEEWVEIIAVTARRSTAKLERSFIDGQEYCSRFQDHNLTEFTCREPRAGGGARTRVDYY